MNKIITLITLVLCVSSSAYCGFMDGSGLAEYCQEFTAKGAVNGRDAICYAYIAGAVDSHLATRTGEDLKPVFCLSDKTNTTQLVLVVKKYLDEHPEKLYLDASSLILLALHEAYPCK